MKAQIPVLLAGLMSALAASSQTYTDLHNFSAASGNPASNYDGASPFAGVILSNNVLYGTTYAAGSNGVGSIYSMRVDGSGFSNLYSFSTVSGNPKTNIDGAQPTCRLLLSGNILFGTTYGGGLGGAGSIFSMDIDGSHYTNLYSFPAGAGAPRSELILLSNVLYGTTTSGGAGYGSVFRINTDGTDFTNIVVFSNTVDSAKNPYTGLIAVNGTLYGETTLGGSTNGQGVIFAVGTDGGGYTNLFAFQPPINGGTGGDPFGTLIYSEGALYGTTQLGGPNGNGFVFSLGTNGSNFTMLHTFSATTNNTNLDGAAPAGALLLAGGILYGTAVQGGSSGRGTVFAINTNGSNFTNLYQFNIITNNSTNAGGNGPVGGLVMSGSTLYGATAFGGNVPGIVSLGNIYSLSLSSPQPLLNFQVIGGNLVLSWSDPTFFLQTSPTLGQAFVTISNSVSPYTTNFSGAQRYFRLKQN